MQENQVTQALAGTTVCGLPYSILCSTVHFVVEILATLEFYSERVFNKGGSDRHRGGHRDKLNIHIHVSENLGAAHGPFVCVRVCVVQFSSGGGDGIVGGEGPSS